MLHTRNFQCKRVECLCHWNCSVVLVHTCSRLQYKLSIKNFNIKIFDGLIVDGITRGEGTPQRPRKQLDLPVLPSMMQQRNQDGGEIESKLQEEIMKMNGILSINGKVRNRKCTVTVTVVSFIYLSF